MNQSENIAELSSALAKAQGDMQAAIKDSINPFFKSKYADLGSVWDAARPVLSKNGLCVIQTTELMNDKIVMVTTLSHSSGQWIKSYLPLNPSKQDSQGIGAAITYLRRYSLSAIVGVVCDDDDDGETAVGRGKVKAVEAKPLIELVSDTQRESVDNLFMELDGENRKSFLGWLEKEFKTRDFRCIPKIAFDKCMYLLNAKIKFLKDQEKVA
jgi:hypothetical protein